MITFSLRIRPKLQVLLASTTALLLVTSVIRFRSDKSLTSWQILDSLSHPAQLGSKPTDFKTPNYVPAQHQAGESPEAQFAYAIFLDSSVAGEKDMDHDDYFVATRILVWQLLHDPETKANGIDVLVISNPDVSEARRDRLQKDGATVKVVDFVHGEHDDWVVPKFSRWAGIMSKLRAWEMEEYARILMLDADILLQYPLDGVFRDPGAQTLQTLAGVARPSDELELPQEYMLGSAGEVKSEFHSFPPKGWAAGDDSDVKKPGVFNAGFFLLQPNKEMFKYYVSLLDLKDRFNPEYMEQNLLNYAHRWDGPMPWKEIAYTWNIRCATDNDFDKGVNSVHQKWWQEPESGSRRLKKFFMKKKQQMERFYRDGIVPEQ